MKNRIKQDDIKSELLELTGSEEIRNLNMKLLLIQVLILFFAQKSNAACKSETMNRAFGKILDKKLENLIETLDQRYNAQSLQSKTCPSNWIQIMDSCIWTSTESLPFYQAVEKCKIFENLSFWIRKEGWLCYWLQNI